MSNQKNTTKDVTPKLSFDDLEKVIDLVVKLTNRNQPTKFHNHSLIAKADHKARRLAKQGYVNFRFKEEDRRHEENKPHAEMAEKKRAYAREPINVSEEEEIHPTLLDVRNSLAE